MSCCVYPVATGATARLSSFLIAEATPLIAVPALSVPLVARVNVHNGLVNTGVAGNTARSVKVMVKLPSSVVKLLVSVVWLGLKSLGLMVYVTDCNKSSFCGDGSSSQ